MTKPQAANGLSTGNRQRVSVNTLSHIGPPTMHIRRLALLLFILALPTLVNAETWTSANPAAINGFIDSLSITEPSPTTEQAPHRAAAEPIPDLGGDGEVEVDNDRVSDLMRNAGILAAIALWVYVLRRGWNERKRREANRRPGAGSVSAAQASTPSTTDPLTRGDDEDIPHERYGR